MEDDTPLKQRLVENEAAFRKQNEDVTRGLQNVADLAVSQRQGKLTPRRTQSIHFNCECSDENCRLRIPIRLDEYERVHANRCWFTIKPGHQVGGVEHIISRSKDYYVVEKHGPPCEPPEHLHHTPVRNV